MIDHNDNDDTRDSEPDPFTDGRPELPDDEPGQIGQEPERAQLPGPRGIDVSTYQSGVDWDKVSASGQRFAYIRLSFSRTSDSRAASHWDGARKAGLVTGGYHFFRFHQNSPVDAQLKAFLAMFHDPRKYGPVALPPALDLEWDQYGMKLADADDRAAYITAARAWLVGIEHALGIRPVIYTGRSYWKEMGNPPDLSDYDLWVASPERTTPRLPTPWPAYRLWQYSHKGDIPGIAGRVDCNAFCGTDAEFAEFVAPREHVFSAS